MMFSFNHKFTRTIFLYSHHQLILHFFKILVYGKFTDTNSWFNILYLFLFHFFKYNLLKILFSKILGKLLNELVWKDLRNTMD